jgi:hypothetical protein
MYPAYILFHENMGTEMSILYLHAFLKIALTSLTDFSNQAYTGSLKG